jgi:GntR family transcriptional repressor for pyruvate dehydrogenase complex
MTENGPASPRARSVPDAIAEALIGEIRAGRIALGATLPPERELCERFDASRPTVREALALMQMRGFLDAGGGRRPRTTSAT